MLAIEVRTHAHGAWQCQGNIQLIALRPLAALDFIEQRSKAIVQGRSRQRRQIQALQLAVQAQHRYFARRQVQVASARSHGPGQQVGHIHETPQRPSSR